MTLLTNLTPLADFVAWMVLCVCRHTADQGARRRMQPTLCNAVVQRVRTLGRRFADLVALVQAGKLPPPRVRRQRAASPRAQRAPRPPSVLPRGFGWIWRVVPEVGPQGGGLLRELILRPDMADLIAAAPQQAGRILRPLCHIFGVKPPEALRLPKWERRPRPRPRRAAPARRPAETPPATVWPAVIPHTNATRPGGLVLNPDYPWDGRTMFIWG